MPEDRIPVFVSCLNRMNPMQEESAELIRGLMDKHHLQWVAPGIGDFSPLSPFQMVSDLIKGCYGGIILGFARFQAPSGVLLPGTAYERVMESQMIASPWHQIEAAALLAREVPILVFKEPDILGGIFDQGSAGVVIRDMPHPEQSLETLEKLFVAFAAEVRAQYEKANAIFDVFLSFSGEDELRVRDVFEFLTSKGLRVFFSRESIPQMAQADYMKAINEALDKARNMVVVSSSAQGFAKPWVEREWTMFLNEKLSGRKSGNVVVVQIGNVPVGALPIALRSQQVISLSEGGLAELLQFIAPK